MDPESLVLGWRLALTGPSEAAAAEVSEALARVGADALLALDLEVRSRTHWVATWASPRDLVRRILTPALRAHRVALLGLLSMSRSGHHREAALRALSVHDLGDECPWVLLRLADPNGVVRAVAEAAARSRLSSGGPAEIARRLPLLVALARRARFHAAPLLDVAYARLASPSADDAVAHAFATAPAADARALARLLLARPGHPPSPARARAGLACPDPDVRAIAVRSLSPADHAPVLAEALRDPHAAVRRAAIERAGETLDAAALRACLFDRSAVVAARAADALAVLGDDPRPIVLAALATAPPPPVRALLALLARVGAPEDAAIPLRWAASPVAGVRRLALRTAHALDADAAAPALEHALDDPDARVRWFARAALRGRAGSLDLARLAALATRRSSPDERFRLLDLLRAGAGRFAAMPGWLALLDDLAERADGGVVDRLRRRVVGALRAAPAGAFGARTEDLARAASALAACRSLDPATRAWVERDLRLEAGG